MRRQDNALGDLSQAGIRGRERQRQMPGQAALGVACDERDLLTGGDQVGEAVRIVDDRIEVGAPVDRLEGVGDVRGVRVREA